jgi:hypothetical protein
MLVENALAPQYPEKVFGVLIAILHFNRVRRIGTRRLAC